LESGQFTGTTRASVLNGPDINSENSEEKPDEVGIKESDLKISGNSFTFSFEPHSVTALVCGVT
jgi:alpha-L-arabinofuranosidase